MSTPEQEWWINMGNISNKASEVSAEELWNIANNIAKWQTIGWQIRDDQKKNTHKSKFLTYLLLHLQDDDIRSYIDMFVTYTDTPDIDHKQVSVMIDEIVWIFLPFYTDIADQLELASQYSIEYHGLWWDLVWYTDYIHQLILYYPRIKQLDINKLIDFIILIMKHHAIIDVVKMDKNKILKLKHTLTQKFFGIV